MVKDNEDNLEMRRNMSIPEELEYLTKYSIRTYNNDNTRGSLGFLEHAYMECMRNEKSMGMNLCCSEAGF